MTPKKTGRVEPLLLALATLLLGGCAAIPPRPAPEVTAGAPAGADGDARVPADARGGPADVSAEPEDGATTADGEADEGEGEAAAIAPEDPRLAAARERILAAARRRLGTRPGLDCSGYVLDAYRAAGFTVRLGPGRSRSESLHAASREVERPRPGDLAFFHDTYDRNRDGRLDDPFTHVALVESVEGDTITLLHRGGRIERIRMDLAHPSDPAANGILRVKRRRDAPGTHYLAGELFTAFGELLEGEFTQTLQVSHAAEAGAGHPATR